jgi:hypothetical protein
VAVDKFAFNGAPERAASRSGSKMLVMRLGPGFSRVPKQWHSNNCRAHGKNR